MSAKYNWVNGCSFKKRKKYAPCSKCSKDAAVKRVNGPYLCGGCWKKELKIK